jgi:hypothetical protein
MVKGELFDFSGILQSSLNSREKRLKGKKCERKVGVKCLVAAPLGR